MTIAIDHELSEARNSHGALDSAATLAQIAAVVGMFSPLIALGGAAFTVREGIALAIAGLVAFCLAGLVRVAVSIARSAEATRILVQRQADVVSPPPAAPLEM